MNKSRASGRHNLHRVLWGLISRHPLALTVLVTAVVALIYFSWQFIENTRLFRELSDDERPIELWMSPRFVAHSWDLSQQEMVKVMRLDSDNGPQPRTIAEVLAQGDLTLEELNARIDIARDCDDLNWFDLDLDLDLDLDIDIDFDDDDANELDESMQHEKATAEICETGSSENQNKQEQHR